MPWLDFSEFGVDDVVIVAIAAVLAARTARLARLTGERARLGTALSLLLGIHLLPDGIGRLLQLLGELADASHVVAILRPPQLFQRSLDGGAVVGLSLIHI